jgi:hypothetical protein
VDAIVSALAKAAAAGRVWRGDGSGPEPGEAPAGPADLPPGAVVAEFDHDDPAYQAPKRLFVPTPSQVSSQARPVADDGPEQNAQVRQAAAGPATETDARDEADAGCVAPSARRRVSAAPAEPVRSATDNGRSANTRSDSGRASGPLGEPFDLGRNGHSSIVSAGVFGTADAPIAEPADEAEPSARETESVSAGLNLPAQAGGGLDALDPLESAADQREVR